MSIEEAQDIPVGKTAEQQAIDLLREASGYVMRCLARREFSQKELMQRLHQRGVEESIAAEVVAQAQTANWQSNERYADAYIRSRIERRQGPLKIRAELRTRGLDDAEINAALGRQAPDWCDMALAYIRLHERFHREPLKARQALLRRGFSATHASHAWRAWEAEQRDC